MAVESMSTWAQCVRDYWDGERHLGVVAFDGPLGPDQAARAISDAYIAREFARVGGWPVGETRQLTGTITGTRIE